MPPETMNNDRRQIVNADQITINHHTSEPDKTPIPCPRCQSTSTKFCYYNNYNMSQPRYICKSCRRYWTKGGALRDIPVGGGSRKKTKRVRTASPSSSCSSITTATPTHDPKLQPVPVSVNVSSSGSTLFQPSVVDSIGNNGVVQSCDADNGSGGFTSLLQSRGPGLLALAGYGYGCGNPVGVGFGEMGYGLNINRGIATGGGVGFWAFPDAGGDTSVVSSRQNSVCPVIGGGVNGIGGGSWAAVDGYGWPDLSITMPR